MGLWFRLAAVTFLGGSMVPIGGHNVVEPMQLSSAVVVGPHMEGLRDIAPRLIAKNAIAQAANADELVAVTEKLLRDDAQRAAQLECAAQTLAVESRTLENIMTALAPVLERAGLCQQ
jgi:3-deoxy-D-manno-octulosonic-acid transferase